MPDYSKIKDNVNNRPIQVQSAIEDGDKKNIQDYYAKQDGFYGGMGVGKSLATESIISDREIEDSEVACSPITFGPTGDGAEISDGISQFDYLEGNSEKWNQQISRIDSYNTNNGNFTYENNEATLVKTTDGAWASKYLFKTSVVSVVTNHKYFISFQIKTSLSNETTITSQTYQVSNTQGLEVIANISVHNDNIWHKYSYIKTSSKTHNSHQCFISWEGDSSVLKVGDIVKVRNFIFIDLTEVYGAGNEPTTVAEFKSKYPLDYYPYSAPSIISSKSYSIISKGKNQFEGLDTFTRVLPNTEYELSGITAGGYIQEYDANKNLIQTSSEITTTTNITLSANTYYVKIQATTYSNIMFYIAYETYNARYVEPTKQTIQLPNIELRSVGDVRDIAYSAGGGLRKVGYVDLGSLNWYYDEPHTRFEAYPPRAKTVSWNEIGNGVCLKYEITAFNELTDKTYALYASRIMLKDSSYTDATTLKQALSGVYLLYEFTDSQDISLTENPGWNSDILVNNYGTLEFTTNPTQLPQVEQPYLIKYSINLVDFLDSTYVRAEGDANKLALQSDMNEVKKDISDFKTGEQSVELAENLNSRMRLSENTPYLFRTTGGSLEVGNQCYENEIVGGSIVVNQLVDTNTTNLTLKSNHKYYTIIAGTKNIVNGADNSISITGGTDNVFDLTQMFGSQIANYIYSLEQANAGAGVAWVKQFLPKDYYEYTATPYFLNVKTTGKKVVGFNAYNNETGTAKLLGGNQYQITGTYTSVSYVDINGDSETLTIDTDGKFTPTNNGVLTVVGGNATDTCVHLVWDGEREGEFEAYKEITYPISDVELRGIPKLDSNNNLYYDGDKYRYDGTVERKYGIVDLGTLTWTYVSGIGFYVIKSDMKPYGGILCTRYATSNALIIQWAPDKSIWNANNAYGTNNIFIRDSEYTDATTFKSAMSGVILYYELRTPTTETADEFTQKQWMDNWGTEEWIDSRTIPLLVGHNTEYAPNLKAKVEVSPESPETDGYYVLKRDGGENSYYDLSSYLTDNNYAKKEEISTTNLGTITTATIVSNSFYHNNIAVSAGVSVGDIVFVQMSNGAVYPTINNNATQLVIFDGSDLSSLTITKAWKVR